MRYQRLRALLTGLIRTPCHTKDFGRETIPHLVVSSEAPTWLKSFNNNNSKSSQIVQDFYFLVLNPKLFLGLSNNNVTTFKLEDSSTLIIIISTYLIKVHYITKKLVL